MRKMIFSCLTMLLALSCLKEGHEEEASVAGSGHDLEELEVKVEVAGSSVGSDVRSIFDEDSIEDLLTDMTLAVYDEDGGMVDVLYHEDLSDVRIHVSRSGDNTLYALANMGDMTALMPQKEEDVSNLTYKIGAYSEVEEKGIPMAAIMTVNVSMKNPVISLERLFAKVNLRILHTSLESANSKWLYAYNLCNLSSYVRQANSRLFPFAEAGSRAFDLADIMEESDYEPDLNDREAAMESYHPSELGPGPGYFQDTTIVFYVPENMQGRLLPLNKDPMKKEAASISNINGRDYSGLCTYIELNAMKVAAGTGLSGTVTYRCYLGSDNVGDFNVERNGRYDLTIDVTDEGFGMDRWKVSKGEDWSDTRSLQFLEDSYVIYPGKAKGVFVHYHRAVGPEYGSELRPDDWTYSFDEEGMKAAGLTFSFNPDMLQSSTDSRRYFCFTFLASASAAVGKGFQMTVRSKDGALEDHSMIYISELGEIEPVWKNLPSFVSQYGDVVVTGVPEDMYPLHAAVSDPAVLKCSLVEGNVFRVTALGPGKSDITFRNRDGSQKCSVSLEVNSPILKVTTDAVALNPDGTAVDLDYAYVDYRGVELTDMDRDVFRSRLRPVVKADPYISVSADVGSMTMMIDRLYSDGQQINTGSYHELTLSAADCPGCGSQSVRAYIVDPFDDFTVRDFGNIDDYTLFSLPGTSSVLYGHFKDEILANSSFKFEVPRPDALSSCVHAEMIPRWRNAFSNPNGVYQVLYSPSDPAFPTGSSVTVNQRSGDASLSHGAGVHDIMLYVTNMHSKERIGASCGKLDVYVHTALGARAVFGSQVCSHRPSGTTAPRFAEIYNSVAGHALYSPDSGARIHYVDVNAEFMMDVGNVYVFDRLLAGARSGSDAYDAVSIVRPDVADGYADSNTRHLYSVNGYDGNRLSYAGEEYGCRKGIGIMLYRALMQRTYDYSLSETDLHRMFFGLTVNGTASGSFAPRYKVYDILHGSDRYGDSVSRSVPYYFAPSSYPAYTDAEGRGYHVIHFLEEIASDTCGWINLL